MKKSVLFVANHLTVGGVQKSLITVLKYIDYDKYDVTLYLRKNRTDLIEQINKNVRIIINNKKDHYYLNPVCLLLQIMIFICGVIGLKDKVAEYNKKLSDKVSALSMKAEKKRFFNNKSFDFAVAYWQGQVTEFVADYISAGKKIAFYHSSIDDLHQLHEKAYKNIDVIAAVGEGVKDMLLSSYPDQKGKIILLKNFVDYDDIRALSVTESPVSKVSNELILCSCGRLSKEKGFDLAVGAASILKKNSIPFHWYFVGDGGIRAEIEKLIAQNELTDEITITGFTSNPYPYIGNCDIYVQPSYNEAQPLSIIEAHILNKPVVSTKTVGGFSLVVPETDGLLCNINSESIAETIIRLYNDSEMKTSIVSYLSRIDYSSDKERYIKEWFELLN